MNSAPEPFDSPTIKIDVLDNGSNCKKGWQPCFIGEQLSFNQQVLQSYCCAPWESVIDDLLLLTAAIEYCDRVKRRSSVYWGRKISLRVPVSDVDRWNNEAVSNSLIRTISFLTGDQWSIVFTKRKQSTQPPAVQQLAVQPNCNVLAFSNGIDSHVIADLHEKEQGNGSLMRVRVGAGKRDAPKQKHFTAIPFSVKPSNRHSETSQRSRAFKFAVITGIASYFLNTSKIIVPESGQGALGPALLTLGHIYPDYRNHPRFYRYMEIFLNKLLEHKVEYTFPRIWYTKAETIKEYLRQGGSVQALTERRSCWQDARQVSINKEWLQCGLCAACMLRRLSLTEAGVSESAGSYVLENLNVEHFEESVPVEWGHKPLVSVREYAIAGIQHMDQLATFRYTDDYDLLIKRHTINLADAMGVTQKMVTESLNGLLERHAVEWQKFLNSLDKKSFIKNWATG